MNKSFDKYFYFYMFTGWILLINIGLIIYSLFYSRFLVLDDLEHLRAAYFVSLGDVPYRDFFEHHHPLLWYVLAPLIKILPHKTLVTLAIGRIISLLLSIFAFYYIIKIMKFETKQKISIFIFAVVILWTIDSFSLFSSIKPDTYARLCYFFALYHLFLYFRDLRFKNLQICAISFCLAFMFIQTIVLQIFPLIFPIGYILYKHPDQIKNMLKAIIIPIIMLGAAAYYFYINDALYLYYEKNWLFNQILSKILIKTHYAILYKIIDPLILAAMTTLIYLYRRKFNIYTTTIILLFCFELLQRIILVESIRYCIYLVIFAAMLATPLLTSFITKYARFGSLIIFGLTAYHLILSFPEFDAYVFPKIYKYEYLARRHLEHEKVITQEFGIYHPRLTYYWMYRGIEVIDGMFFEGHRDYNINHVIRDHKVRFIPEASSHEITMEEPLKKILTKEQKEILKKHEIDSDTCQDFQPCQDTECLERKD